MNNVVTLVGFAKDENTIEAIRPSGIADLVPVPVPSTLVGKRVQIEGEFVSYNTYDRKLKLYVRPYNISTTDAADRNTIHLEGFICKAPIYRKTPAGRDITDLLIAVNHGTESSYLPCIYWGNAEYLNIGDPISIDGRIQSREYLKNNELHRVNEVSIEKIK